MPFVKSESVGGTFVLSAAQMVYTTACCSNDPVGDADFLPLQVHYAERFSAAGRTRCAPFWAAPLSSSNRVPMSVDTCGLKLWVTVETGALR